LFVLFLLRGKTDNEGLEREIVKRSRWVVGDSRRSANWDQAPETMLGLQQENHLAVLPLRLLEDGGLSSL
jgi:hypothetical protein